MTTEPIIVTVIRHYYPEWQPPKAGRFKWLTTKCPFHADELASASVSYEYNAFKCHACGVAGNYITIIKQREEVTYAEAVRFAEAIAEGSGNPLPPQLPRQPSRRLYGEPGPGVPVHQGEDGHVHAGVRSRPTPW